MLMSLPLLVQFAVFWIVVAALGRAGVTTGAWAALYTFAVAAFLAVALIQRPAGSVRRWLVLLFYSVFFAALFYFANAGLDVLHGAARPKTEVAPWLGGLEFWFFLCPGVSAFAAAGLVRALLTARWQQRRA